MNYPDISTLSTTAKKIRFSSATRALLFGLALALPGTAALAIGEPIPGIDIVVKKNPGGIAVTLPSDASGKFSLRLQEAGNYTISTACRQPSGCLPHTLSGAPKPGANGEPSTIAILVAILFPAQKASAEGLTAGSNPRVTYDGVNFNFTVGERGVILSGQFQDTPDVRIAVGDVTGDGRRVANTISPVNDASVIPADPVIVGGPRPIALPGTLAIDGEAISALVGVSTTRGTAPPPPKGGDKERPGLASPGTPIQDTEVGLQGDPGSIKVSANTNSTGDFQFDKLPAGKYKLTLPGLPPQSITVGSDGIAGGKVMRGSDDNLSIFDRWGNIVASSLKNDGIKAAGTPFGFGSGNTPGFGPGTGAGPGMGPGMVPGAGPAIGSPMSPGPNAGGGPMGPGPMVTGPAGPGAGAMRR